MYAGADDDSYVRAAHRAGAGAVRRPFSSQTTSPSPSSYRSPTPSPSAAPTDKPTPSSTLNLTTLPMGVPTAHPMEIRTPSLSSDLSAPPTAVPTRSPAALPSPRQMPRAALGRERGGGGQVGGAVRTRAAAAEHGQRLSADADRARMQLLRACAEGGHGAHLAAAAPARRRRPAPQGQRGRAAAPVGRGL